MYYTSTRNNTIKATAAEAIAQGISREGGLFVPAELPKLTQADLIAMQKMTYAQRATLCCLVFSTISPMPMWRGARVRLMVCNLTRLRLLR